MVFMPVEDQPAQDPVTATIQELASTSYHELEGKKSDEGDDEDNLLMND